MRQVWIVSMFVVGCSVSTQDKSEVTSQALVHGASVVALAQANIGGSACGTNSLGGKGFASSCYGNGGLPEYWCADFARWVWGNAGADTGGLTAAAGSFYVYGQQHGTLSNTPSVGAAVVFNYKGGGYADHVALVSAVHPDGTIETISGDWGGQSGSQAYFASTAHVVANGRFGGAVGSWSGATGMTISGYIQPAGGFAAVSSDPVIAFQANTTSLWSAGAAGTGDHKLGLMPGTSPAITKLDNGGYEIAFQANTGNLWTTGTAGTRDWGLGMMKGTSPSITWLPGGGFAVAFQANTGNLWTAGTRGVNDWQLGLHAKSSPSITTLAGGGFEIAFEANTTSLWTVGDAGNRDWQLGMMAGTSPGIAGLAQGGYEATFQANTGNLWTAGTLGVNDWQLGMHANTNPSIVGLPDGGFEIAFQANTTSLWTVGNAGNKDWQLGMMPGSSPSIASDGAGGFTVAFEANTTSLWIAGTHGVRDLGLGMFKGTSPAAH